MAVLATTDNPGLLLLSLTGVIELDVAGRIDGTPIGGLPNFEPSRLPNPAAIGTAGVEGRSGEQYCNLYINVVLTMFTSSFLPFCSLRMARVSALLPVHVVHTWSIYMFTRASICISVRCLAVAVVQQHFR